MEPLEIAKRLQEKFPEDVREIKQYSDQVSVIVKRDNIRALAGFLKSDPSLDMDLLRDLCGADYFEKKTPRFEVVYHFYSIRFRHLLRIRAEISEDDPAIDSLVPLYAGANWHERECFDLFGVRFNDHPDLRRILLPDDWEGHPLRKDYPTKGYEGEQDWQRFQNLLKTAKANEKYGWYANRGDNE